MSRREILMSLVADAGRGGLAFPTSAVAALRIHQALDDPDCSTDAIARQIQAEPLLAARVVALANSAAYNRSGRVVTDVKNAVNLLGFRAVKMLATVMITRLMASSAQLPGHKKIGTALWEHTAHVAALAQMLARRVTHQDAETAMFAGMLHEIGGFYLVYRASDVFGVLDGDPGEWENPSAEGLNDAPEWLIGRALFKSLAVPTSVIEAIEVMWKGKLSFPVSTLGDTLLLAYELAPVKSPLRSEKVADGEVLAANMNMAIGEETLDALIKDSTEEVTALVWALER